MTNSVGIFGEHNRPGEQAGSDSDRIADEAANWFARLSDEEASEADFAAYREWRALSKAHAEAFDHAATVYASLGEFSDAPEIIEMRLAALAQSRQSSEPVRAWTRYGAIAASVVLVFLVSAFILLNQSERPANRIRPANTDHCAK